MIGWQSWLSSWVPALLLEGTRSPAVTPRGCLKEENSFSLRNGRITQDEMLFLNSKIFFKMRFLSQTPLAGESFVSIHCLPPGLTFSIRVRAQCFGSRACYARMPKGFLGWWAWNRHAGHERWHGFPQQWMYGNNGRALTRADSSRYC